MASIAIARLGLSASRSLAVLPRPILSLSEGSSRRALPTSQWRRYSEEQTKYSTDYLQGLVKEKPLVLFMKGEPSAPMCGFSRLVVQILHMHGLEEYDHYDVLEDVEFKEAMKKFSNWPTFPQVYMDGELVGGADIMLQMHQNGELVLELEKIGHRSVLIDQPASDTDNKPQ